MFFMSLNLYINLNSKTSNHYTRLITELLSQQQSLLPLYTIPIVILIRRHKTMTPIRLSVYIFMTLVYLKTRKTEE